MLLKMIGKLRIHRLPVLNLAIMKRLHGKAEAAIIMPVEGAAVRGFIIYGDKGTLINREMMIIKFLIVDNKLVKEMKSDVKPDRRIP